MVERHRDAAPRQPPALRKRYDAFFVVSQIGQLEESWESQSRQPVAKALPDGRGSVTR